MNSGYEKRQEVAMTDTAKPKLTLAQRQELWRDESRLRAERAFQDVPILVYTMGKVGSSTVHHSLREAGFGERTFHIHSLRPDYLATWRRALNVAGVEVPHTIHESEAVLEQMNAAPDRPIKVVTLIRDPLAREVSDIYENPYRAPHIVNEDGSFHVQLTVNHLTTELAKPRPCNEFFKWFPEQPGRVLGIDVLATPFDKERGWQIYRQGRVEMLLIRLEDLSRVGTDVLTEFIGASEPIEMIKSHVRQDDSYPVVKRKFKVPHSVCEEIHQHPMMRHFYSEAQLDDMRSRWTIADETPDAADQRVRAALLMEIRFRRKWGLRETAALKSDLAARAETIDALQAEKDRLDIEVARLTNEIARLHAFPFRAGVRTLRSAAGHIKRRIAAERHAA